MAPRIQIEFCCPMCGHHLGLHEGKGRSLRPGGAPYMVERTYAGPGRVSQRPLSDSKDGPYWSFLVRRIMQLADRFGIELSRADAFAARADRAMSILVESEMVQSASVDDEPIGTAAVGPVSWTESGVANELPRTRPAGPVTWEEER